MWVQDPQDLNYPPWLSHAVNKAELDVEQSGQEPVPLW